MEFTNDSDFIFKYKLFLSVNPAYLKRQLQENENRKFNFLLSKF